ncbi:MAG TPA: CHAT domain-containing protein [Thermoanaerobaculia bacterium]|nr:CHAT domain-containing protein [Thermoanaerobaculia bacterium]
MTRPTQSPCPDDETLAAWVDGRLPEHERAALIEHASTCETCIVMLDVANMTLRDEPRGGWQRWMLAVAALVVLAVTSLLVFRARQTDPLHQLVNNAPRSARTVEARLSGGFAYAPYRGSMRANGAAADTEQMKLMGTAAEALERAERNSSEDAERAAAVALVLIGRAEEAVPRLTAIANRHPNDLTAWNDLAAAQYSAALAGRTSLYPEALASANRARRIDALSREALFNRALILERMALRDEARAAWQRYLQIDPASSWATEAREHLARLHAVLPNYEEERARAYAEVEYLGRWATAFLHGDEQELTRWLTTAREIGAALEQKTGESLLRDAVQSIDTADSARRRQIATAHELYRTARIAFSRHMLDDADRDLRRAADAFASANDPMALAARSYAAGATLARNDVGKARGELRALAAEVDARNGYLSLAAQVRWELGRALMFDGDWNGAALVLREAEQRFRRAGEHVNEATIGAMLAEALIAAGRPDEAWSAEIRAFETFSLANRNDLLDATISNAATTALRAGRAETARALIAIDESLQRGLGNELLLADTLVRKSMLDAQSDTPAAIRASEEATSIAMRIPDASLRARHLADADLAHAAALLEHDPKRAGELASHALDLYASAGMVALQAEPYLIRARSALRLGDTEAAQRDLDAGIAAVEQHPMRVAGAVIGTGVLDAGNALFDEAIHLDLERNDAAAVFTHFEHRKGFVSDAADLRRRLRGTNTAVLALIVLPREVVSIAITERDVQTARHAIERTELARLVDRDDDASSAQLYALLIPKLDGIRSLIIIPDELLERVPFGALGDLVERMAVAIAPSASALQLDRDTHPPSRIAEVGLPSGQSTAPLPEAELELSEIGALYRNVRRIDSQNVTAKTVEDIAWSADVLHIAGHTEGDEALAVSGDAISWRTIAAMNAMPPIVVLSACNTLRRPRDADRRALSLAGAFVAAGAREVIGTLAPIGDADARTLFFALHEELARGIAPAEALRRVQIAQRGHGRAWRRLALLTTSIHRVE